MQPIRTVANKTYLGGRSLKEYSILASFLLGILAFRIYGAQTRISDAIASGDLELVQMIQRSIALSPLTTALPLIVLLSFAGLGVIDSEFRNRTAVMILTRIERLQFYIGSWVGLMAFVVSAYAFVLLIFGALMFFYGLPLSPFLGLAILKEFAQALMIYSIAFAFGAVAPRPVLCFIIAIVTNGFVQGFSQFGTVSRYVLGGLYFLYPAQLGEDLLHMATTTSQTEVNYSLIALVIGENLLYIGAILIVAYAIFQRREVMAR